MISYQYVVYVSFAISFILTFVATALIIPRLKTMGISGADGHKPDKPQVPEMGGVAIMFGFTVSVLAGSMLLREAIPGYGIEPILAVLGVFLLSGFIGVVDDRYKLHHHIKPLLLLLAALPLILLRTGDARLRMPFLNIDFTNILGVDATLLFWIIVVPVAVSGAANVSNMLAGFNGLLSGLAIVSSSAMAAISLLAGRGDICLVFSSMAASHLAFLHFNKCPARIFPGDVGTLGFGAMFAAGIIAGNLEFLGLVVFLPQILNASASLLSVGRFFEEKQFRKEKLSALNVTPAGLISFTRLEKPITLCKILLYNRPQTESMLVFRVCVISMVSSILALCLALVWY